VEELATTVGIAEACRVLGVPRSSHYRARQPSDALAPPPRARPAPARALSDEQRTTVHEVLNSPRFQDCAVRQVYATLLDEQVYLCSWRTMYRILAQANEVRERRDQLRHPSYTKPELLATQPRELWRWDITKLKGPAKWTYYYLYLILDVFSRYVGGWMISEHETAELAEALIAETCAKEGIGRDQLTLHADRGSAMTSKSVAHLLSDLGVTKTHSRPHVSNDNPYSEAQFKTLKYRPDFPAQFGSLADGRAWARPFFEWYNQEHYHSGLGLLTPAIVHCGQAAETIAARQQVLLAAYQANPKRFVRGTPKPPVLPTAVWINPPTDAEPGMEQLSVLHDRAQVSVADSSQPIFLKFGPELSQTA
jgi:putative transposase